MPSSDTPAAPPWGLRLREDAARIIAETLTELNPAGLTATALADHIEPLGWSAEIVSRPAPHRTVLVAVGKAGLAMARGAIGVLGRAVDDGVVLVPHDQLPQTRPDWLPRGIRLRAGGHPIPDAAGRAAAEEIETLADGLEQGDRLLVLISGGGSALLTAPREGIDFEELRTTTRLLLESGLDIRAMNLVRSVTERLKGGGLARTAAPAEVLGLVLSDVPGDSVEVVASGPISSPVGRPRDAEALLRRESIWEDLPQTVQTFLMEHRTEPIPREVGDTDATPVPRTVLVGSGDDAARVASAAARKAGYTPSVLDRELAGEARRAGRGLARAGLAVRDGLVELPLPACLIATGETTVKVVGTGRGGRNQEVALGAAQYLRGRPGVLVVSVGTDGIDGPTDAAGGWVDGESWDRADATGTSVDDALARNDAYPLLKSLGDLILTGPTGTNVADLMLVLVGVPESGTD